MPKIQLEESPFIGYIASLVSLALFPLAHSYCPDRDLFKGGTGSYTYIYEHLCSIEIENFPLLDAFFSFHFFFVCLFWECQNPEKSY